MVNRSPTPHDELSSLLDTAVAQLGGSRRTFTDEQALRDTVWARGYEIGLQHDLRFVLVQEGQGAKSPRQWRLTSHTVANNLLLERLLAGLWDGREVDAELARLDGAAGGHHVFCASDPRFISHADGRVTAAREPWVTLDAETRQALENLAPTLLEEWQQQGAEPRTLRQLTEMLGALGWPGAAVPGAITTVRSWLLDWPQVLRVGQDYWVPASALPQAPARRRLGVLPVNSPYSPAETPASHPPPEAAGEQQITPPSVGGEIPTTFAGRGKSGGNQSLAIATWVQVLRTVHVVEGFLPLPAAVRAAIPAQAPGAARWDVLVGKWFDTGETLWIWLDRDGYRFCGPGLAEQLAWCGAGERLRLTWTSEVLLLQTAGIDTAIQQQETRLVDPEALATLRGGLGESYRRSVLAVLVEQPNGLPFRELVPTVCERQQHSVHPGTVRAILSAGGFEQREGRWYALDDAATGARRFRRALLMTRTATEDSPEPATQVLVCDIAHSVRTRLKELQMLLR